MPPLGAGGFQGMQVQVDGTELRAAEVNALEPGATQIGTHEVSHATTLTSRADHPRAHGAL